MNVTLKNEGIQSQSHCCFCSMQCGIVLSPSDKDGGLALKPSPDFPVATGRLCQKGLNALEHVIHEDRVLLPLHRDKGESRRPRGTMLIVILRIKSNNCNFHTVMMLSVFMAAAHSPMRSVIYWVSLRALHCVQSIWIITAAIVCLRLRRLPIKLLESIAV